MQGTLESFHAWFDALYARHTHALQFAEIRRALQALSTIYVHHRDKLARHQAMEGRGKRAAFALFYAPVHFLTMVHIGRALRQGRPLQRVIDLGCGTGSGGAALAACGAENAPRPHVTGLDVNTWALSEAQWNWRHWQLPHQTARADVGRLGHWLRRDAPCAVVVCYVVNELPETARHALLRSLLLAAQDGHEILVVEPISKSITPWWDAWSTAFVAVGGRTDAWRVTLDMPDRLRLLDKASGMNHAQIKARSLYLRPTGDAALAGAI